MEKLFRKKAFLEIYIPLGIPVGAIILLITGLSFLLSFVLGMMVALIGSAVYLKRKKCILRISSHVGNNT